MNSKEILLNVLTKNKSISTAVTPHWWGLYKFEQAGLIKGYEDDYKAWGLTGKELAEYDMGFYDTFKPDMFHLTTGAAQNINQENIKNANELKNEVNLLTSKNHIDQFISLIWRSKQEIIKDKDFSHMKILAEKYGEEVFIAANEGVTTGMYFDPHGYVGFEQGLIGMLEEPENTQYFLKQIYDMTFERVSALKEMGCHAYISSETYCSSDLISPQMYKDIIFPLQKEFFNKVNSIGIVPIIYFTGDIIPLLDYIKQLGVAGLMVEESKKNFSLDVNNIADKLENEVALFGNMDSVYVLQKGTVDDVKNETLRQLEATRGKRFIMSNGCPISFGTPKENIHTMIDVARGWIG